MNTASLRFGLGVLWAFSVASVACAERLTPDAWRAEERRCHGNLKRMIERIRTADLPVGYRTSRTADEMFEVLKKSGRFKELGLTEAEGKALVREVWKRIGPAPKRAPVARTTGEAKSVLTAPGYRPRPEFGSLDAILLRWPQAMPTLRDEYAVMVREFSAAGVSIHLWVDSAAVKDAAIRYLTEQGVSVDSIVWTVHDTDSIWIRDYGPIFLYPSTGSEGGLVDFRYYDSRPNDDAVPQEIATASGMLRVNRQTRLSVYASGGNINVDGRGVVAFSTRTYDNNPQQPSAMVDAKIQSALQAPLAIVPEDPALDGTGHVDMFMKMVGPDTVLCARYNEDQTDYQILEDNALLLEQSTNGDGVPWTVVRIPQPDVYYVGFVVPIVRTYTNSVIVNDVVIVPTYGIPEDSEALAVYAAVLPGRRIVPLDANDIIEMAGAWHCVTMEYPTPGGGE